ncbi:glyoxysomal processing protease, glyoxysomal isoform X2 [Carica papaya]|uniref:glyoxysomal processing protease, glyoxysomal isoform X2 n=1 Tax=Carica papaya TaxID=3649 RepID=UPI000B8C6FEE|nr:glyoxysomal processing protease, glyoxysomal isoform X2 [Carica papaya]
MFTKVDVPASSLALQSLIEASSSSLEHGWEVGWSLASYDNDLQTSIDIIRTPIDHESKSIMERQRHFSLRESRNPSVMGRSTTRVAVLGLSLGLEGQQNLAISPLNRSGDFLLAVGSPFGVLSPVHFFNSMSAGSIANCYPPGSSKGSLLMADIRCLPGMEGCPVFGEHAQFVGILVRPLRHKNDGAEIQLVIPWEAIATACSDLLLKEPQNAENGIHINEGNLNGVGNKILSNSLDAMGPCYYKYGHSDACFHPDLPVEKAMASICLITINDGVWASGVVVNDQGLILTNAHLLEPWRFGKTTVSGRQNGNNPEALSFQSEGSSPGNFGIDNYQKGLEFPKKEVKNAGFSMADGHGEHKINNFYSAYRKIRVRLDHQNPWIWCDAKVVYISKGPLDVALLQLEHVPHQLSPITTNFEHPSLGSKAYIIGHGLFGPRCGFSPSVCSGVVAKIIKAKMPPFYQSILKRGLELPAMLETTAAVHPGGSGGAVVNSNGHMIALVTSNARHGGGTIIPNLNFSIPCAVLAPIFEFARDMSDLSLLQNLDQPNKHLSSIWALMPPLSSKPKSPSPNLPESLMEDHKKEGRGSRFSKFIAERHEILKGSSPFGKAEGFSNVHLPSKL